MNARIVNLITYFFSLKFKRFFREVWIIIDSIKYMYQKNKKSVLNFPPRYVTLLTNGQCTNQCTFCVHHSLRSKNSFSQHLYKPNYKISLADFKTIVDKAYAARVPHVHICAMGEPTLHKNFLDFLDYIIKKYGTVSFQSNFNRRLYERRNIVDEIIKRKNKIKYITTDILSADKKQHNEIKKGSDFDFIINSLSKISKHAPKIKFYIHLILTKHNYKNIDTLVNLLASKNINGKLDIVNLHPYNYENDIFTSEDSVYKGGNSEIELELKKALEAGKANGFEVNIPKPFDAKSKGCGVFWSRLQVNFVLTEDGKIAYDIGNALPGDCNAVVKGKLKTLGNVLDDGDLWDLWNGEVLVKIRKNLLKNIYPDQECRNCQNYIN